jgi:hypothetical protein
LPGITRINGWSTKDTKYTKKFKKYDKYTFYTMSGKFIKLKRSKGGAHKSIPLPRWERARERGNGGKRNKPDTAGTR